MEKLALSVIIPTYNEELNIARAVNSVKDYVQQVMIADSFSTDRTLIIAKDLLPDIDILSLECVTFSRKMNSALESKLLRNNWVMRLDADEIVHNPESFFCMLRSTLESGKAGVYCNRRYYFLGHWIRYGGMYPRKVMRIFKRDSARFEDRLVDEKMIINGETEVLDIDIADINQKGFLNWVRKHIINAQGEARQSFKVFSDNTKYDLDFDNKTRENKKQYYKAPIFIRPILYFLYRVVIQKGIKDGIMGVFYHFMHAFVYREIVDFFILKYKVFSPDSEKK